MNSKIDMKKITFRNETPADYWAVENLTREAFWNVYKPGCDEHFVLHNFRSRSDFVPELDIIMEENGVLVGHVMFVRTEIKLNNGKNLPIMTFGPISIAPDFKHKGYGTILLRHAMQKAKEMGLRRTCNHWKHRLLRKKRLCRGKDKRCLLRGRPGCGLFSDKRADSRVFGQGERSWGRNFQGTGRIFHLRQKRRRSVR